jgi:hypothetical protein
MNKAMSNIQHAEKNIIKSCENIPNDRPGEARGSCILQPTGRRGRIPAHIHQQEGDTPLTRLRVQFAVGKEPIKVYGIARVLCGLCDAIRFSSLNFVHT